MYIYICIYTYLCVYYVCLYILFTCHYWSPTFGAVSDLGMFGHISMVVARKLLGYTYMYVYIHIWKSMHTKTYKYICRVS